MIDGKSTGIDVADFMVALAKASDEGARVALRGLAELQKNLIYARKTPDGGGQQENAKSTQLRKTRQKVGTTPLKDKGILTDPSQWVIRKREGEIVLRPPPSRARTIWINAAAGYETVFVKLPPAFEKMLQAAIDKKTDKVKAKGK